MINIPCLIVGDSGSGKSSTFRSLPADKTVIVNTERKPMPFKGFRKFKNIDIKRYKDYQKVIKELTTNKEYEYVVIDSLTSLLEIANKYCETIYTGYNIWSEYNSMVYNILQDMKDLPQQVFITAIPEYVDTGEGVIKSVPKTKGKEWANGAIAKEFAIVLYTHLIANEEGDITDYMLLTSPSKHSNAKSPADMFKNKYIENDAVKICKAINDYYEDDS